MKEDSATGYITELGPKEIIIFGSNLAGRHGKGLALTCKKKFGAIQGVGEGLMGNCYAFPTKDKRLITLETGGLIASFINLKVCVESRPDLTFYLTKVGTGLAGISEEIIKSLFNSYNWPSNLIKPNGWE